MRQARHSAGASLDLPLAGPGQRIGLLGGSFDPPHSGHVHITREALKRFRLDAVWWLVSPGNPLKAEGPAPLTQRMAAARAVMRHPRVHITDVEAQLGTRYTAATLAALVRARPLLRFVWLMGADNLAQLHRWDRWEDIMHRVPVGVLARPGHRLRAATSPAALRYRAARMRAAAAGRLALAAPPAWCFVNMPLSSDSSTAIRARGEW